MKEQPLQILLVEDNAGDARLLHEMFSKERPGSFVLTHLVRMGEAVTHLSKGGVDIVLLDMGLPDGHGLDTVRRAHAAAPGVPLIVLTGLDDELLAAAAMKEGAQDYLIKGQIENRALPRALRHAIERHRMQTETELIRKNQMQFKDEFLSHVSHELRGPLTAVYQFVSVLADGLAGDLNVEQHEYLEIVLRNVKQLQSMINDLLEVTSVQAGKLAIEPQCTSISDAVIYAVDTLQRRAAVKNITLSADMEGELPLIWADPTRVRQILVILLDNAIKFTPSSGTVRVRAHRLANDPHFVELEVSDSGNGISPDKTELIFERLFQVSDPALAGRNGLGLGLYICKELVTRQGGKITAENGTEHGAVFKVTLPVFSLPHLIAPTFQKRRDTGGPTMLLVVEIGSQTGWLSESVRAEHSHWIRDSLKGCLRSESDVLLPKMGAIGAVELFFILVIADSMGALAITKRIREKLHAGPEFLEAGLKLETSFRSLEPIHRYADESVEFFLEKVAIQIQASIDSMISSRMVRNG